MASEDELILRCAQDPEAFRSLVGIFGTRVYSFIIHLAGPRAADDLFQEAWLRVLKGSPGYQARGKASGWIFQIARNVCLRHFERARREGDPVDPSAFEAVACVSPGPSASAEHSEAGRRIAAAIASLPEEQRQVFLLREYGGLSFKEVAEETGVPLGTALSRMNAALVKLRKDLEDLRA